ncbi:MAG: hypothetical protein U5L96_04055 [Owenweeksia sp.]|nr:hypothetical protein [Owenweeksia sp.]
MDLQPFKGNIIKLQFRVPYSGLGADKNDVALDDIKIRNVAANDIELASLENDLTNPCAPSSNIPLDAILQDGGFGAISQFPLAYQLNNGNTVWDTATGLNLNLSDTLNFKFSQPISYSTGVSHTLKIWTSLPNDANQLNDTIQIQFTPSSTAINQFPHILDFENATANSGPGNLNSSFWQMNANNQGAFFKISERL